MSAAISITLVRRATVIADRKPLMATATATTTTATVIAGSQSATTTTTTTASIGIGSSGMASGSGPTVLTTTPMAMIAGGFGGKRSPPEAPIGGRATTPAFLTTKLHGLS